MTQNYLTIDFETYYDKKTYSLSKQTTEAYIRSPEFEVIGVSVQFNDEKPEIKNIMLPNKKENLLKVYEGDKWVYKNKLETISDLVDSKYNIIDDYNDFSIIDKIIKSKYMKLKIDFNKNNEN